MFNLGKTKPMWNEEREQYQNTKVTPRKETATEYILGWSLIVSLVAAGALLAVDNEWAGVVLVFVTVPLVLKFLAT